MSGQLWRCKCGGDVVAPANSALLPVGHYVKVGGLIPGRWCEMGYEPYDPDAS